MLLFIQFDKYEPSELFTFQYISCYSLSMTKSKSRSSVVVSIHLMLLFIPVLPCQLARRTRVSIHLMLLFIRIILFGFWQSLTFQYISCYSLSRNRYPGTCYCCGFQYISCYSLSNHSFCTVCLITVSIHLMLLFIVGLSALGISVTCFNTSHVTLYRHKLVTARDFLESFNTSHVTLYLLPTRK